MFKSSKWWVSIAIVAMSALFLHQVASGDFFHHLNSGRYIFENWQLPYLDSLTFTAYGQYWVDHSWGSGLLYYIVHLFSGFNGVSVLFALFALAMLASVYGVLKRNGVGIGLALSITWLVAGALALYWPARPLVMGPVLLAILLYLLTRYDERKWRFVLLPLFWLWTLLYGASSIMGLAVLTLFLVINKKFNWVDIGIFIGVVILSLLNGYGWNSLLYLLRIPAFEHLQEWRSVLELIGLPLLQSTKWRLATYFGLFLMTITAWVIQLSNKQKDKQVIFYSLLALGVFLPLVSFRMLILVPVLVAPLLGLVFARNINTNKVVLPIICALALCFTITGLYLQGWPKQGLASQSFPVVAVEALSKENINGNIFAPQGWGAYISWVRPESKVFFDTRDELFENTDVFKDDDSLYQGKMGVFDILNKYQSNIVVGSSTNPLLSPLLLSSDWQIIHNDDKVFVVAKGF